MGDHRPVLADFTQASVLGINLPRIEYLAARRLISKVDRTCGKYIKDLGALIKRSRILERLKDIAKKSSNELSREAEEALQKIY